MLPIPVAAGSGPGVFTDARHQRRPEPLVCLRVPIGLRTLGRYGVEGHDGPVVHVARLVTFVEVDDTVADPRQMSVSARHEAVLTNGDRVLLLVDRGWSSSVRPSIWTLTSVEEIADTARMVVGPGRFNSVDARRRTWRQTTWPRLLRFSGVRELTRTLWSWGGYRTTSCSARSCSSASAISQETTSSPDALLRVRRRARFHLPGSSGGAECG